MMQEYDHTHTHTSRVLGRLLEVGAEGEVYKILR